MNCLKLLNENTAVALSYGFFRRKDFDDKEQRYVAFLDVGHGYASCTVASFTQKKVKIVSHAYDRNLGGRNFDALIVDRLSEEFEKKYGVNPKESPKARLRMLNQIEKGRKTLSANKEATIAVECLMEDEDLCRHFQREEFEGMIEPYVRKLEDVVEKCIKQGGISLDKIHSVEMIGEATRIPSVQEVAKKAF